MEHYAVHIHLSRAEEADLLIGLLSEVGFEGFEEKDHLLIGYINTEDFPGEDKVKRIVGAFPFEIEHVPFANWNEQWEHSFNPVMVGDFCGIRADFHAPLQHVKHEIIITPRMAFGTGHHATTASMIQLMEMLDFQGKRVLDFGTGTGILAILAAKMGATEIVAADNDPMAIENARQNMDENEVAIGKLVCTDSPQESWAGFDIILANINRNIILASWSRLTALLKPAGVMLVSGFLDADKLIMEEVIERTPLRVLKERHTSGWLALMTGTEPNS